jgi:murein DD-endopeptidase MepM/ murein hydrolase activator NlpD
MNRFLYQPLKPFITNQKFGESILCYNKITDNYINKTNGVCPAGYVSYYESVGLLGHDGWDLAASYGQPVYASQDGWVSGVSTEIKRGLGVSVITNKRFILSCGHSHFVMYINWHFLGVNVRVNDKIFTGDLLGWADTTGASSGNHDHFAIMPLTDEYAPAHQNNGYRGWVDPEPYTFDKYALDVKGTLQYIKERLAVIAEQIAELLRKRSHG